MPGKEGKYRKESLMETFRMIAVGWSDTTHSNYKLSCLHNCLMVLWNKQLLVALVSVKQPSVVLNIHTFKIKINSKHFTSSRIAPKHPKGQIFIYEKIYLPEDIHSVGKTQKPD